MKVTVVRNMMSVNSILWPSTDYSNLIYLKCIVYYIFYTMTK